VTNRVASRLQFLRHWTALVLGRTAPATHGERRHTRLIQTVLTAFLGRGLTIVVGLITVPLTIGYLGAERYGIWVTISTLLVWFQLADLGFGNGLTNALAEAYGSDRADLAQQYVATAFWALTAIALVLGAITSWLLPQINWGELVQLQSAQSSEELTTALFFALVIACLTVPLITVEKVFFAYQEGALANAWTALGSLVSLVAVLIVISTRGGLVELVCAFSGSPLIVRVISGVWLFGYQKRWLAPLPSRFNFADLRRLLLVGTGFLVTQIAAMVLFQSDTLIIVYFLGPEPVAEYSVVYRLFAVITMVQMLLLAPLWPAYGEAAARADWDWVKRTFRRTLVFNLSLFGVVILAVSVLGQLLVRLWTAGVIEADQSLILLVALWTLMVIWGNSFSILLNGLDIIRPQAITSIVMAALNLGLSIMWVRQIGVNGVILATVVSYGLTSLWVAPIIAYKMFNRVGDP
jgi:O-antigen/teichoic acid export membrane protein